MTAVPQGAHRTVEGETDPAVLGAEGNERLTAWAGAALLIGFAVEGFTILDVHWYLTEHMVIGLALFAPLAVKIGSTGYRFSRYYRGDPAYRRQGPPWLPLRVLAPFLLVNTLVVMLTGVAITIAGDYRRPVEALHKVSFITWFALTAVHVLAYVWRLPRLMLADLRGRGTPRGSAVVRVLVVGGSGVVGVAVAALALPWVRSWIAGG